MTGPAGPGADDSGADVRGTGDPDTGERGADATLALGAAVTLLALAGICALLGGHFRLGALRLAAGILAGAGVGAGLLAALGTRGRRGLRLLLAAGTALALALVLTIPAVLNSRIPPLAQQAHVVIDPLAEDDLVHSLPAPDTPVLVRRASGQAQLLDAQGARSITAAPEDVIALSEDGTRAVHVTAETTEVLTLDRSVSGGADGGLPSISLDGAPLALDGDLIVMRHCEEELCRLTGHDLTAPETPLWSLLDAEETRGIDPAGHEIPARPAQPPGPLDALRAAGVLPTIPLRFAPAQGWTQLDPATGFPVGRILAGADEDCRLTPTRPLTTAQDPLHEAALVMTVCSAPDGALTATAFQDGEQLWQSEPSPAGTWSVRLDGASVLATGTEEGAEVAGEIVATGQHAAWAAPGGDGVRQASAFTARIGIDAAAMVVTNDVGQLLAYDTVDGTNLWTLPLTSPDAEVAGSLAQGTAVVRDSLERQTPLTPRGAERLRVLDAASGEVTVDTEVAERIEAAHPLGGGRALVTVDGQALLLGT